MKISSRFGIESYSWKIDIILENFVNIADFLFVISYAKLYQNMSQYPKLTYYYFPAFIIMRSMW